jgi:hypothetical protein
MTPSEYSRLTDGFDPIGMTPLEIRTAMVENGYAPIPVRGKAPILNDWPAIVATKEVVEQWGNVGPSTGLITTMTPVLDIDILHEQAADIVEATARLYLEDKGQILVRIGLPPKRAIPLRTDKPFSGIQRHLLAPDGTPHLIEVRASRQQVVVAGIHDDTKKPYVWKGGRSPINVPRDQLPPADDIQTILDLCVGELKAKLGWTEAGAPAAKEPMIGDAPGQGFTLPSRLSLEERLQQTKYKGQYGLNDAILAMTASLISDSTPVARVIDECMQFVRGIWEKIPDEHPDKASWNWNTQRDQIADAFLRLYQKGVQ